MGRQQKLLPQKATPARPFLRFLAGAGALCMLAVLAARAPWNGTAILFQSSDGNWAATEGAGKRDLGFQGIQREFGDYKRKCGALALGARLQRATPRPPWWNPTSWFDDYSEPQWQVPYAEALPHLQGLREYPVDTATRCHRES